MSTYSKACLIKPFPIFCVCVWEFLVHRHPRRMQIRVTNSKQVRNDWSFISSLVKLLWFNMLNLHVLCSDALLCRGRVFSDSVGCGAATGLQCTWPRSKRAAFRCGWHASQTLLMRALRQSSLKVGCCLHTRVKTWTRTY